MDYSPASARTQGYSCSRHSAVAVSITWFSLIPKPVVDLPSAVARRAIKCPTGQFHSNLKPRQIGLAAGS